MFLQHLVHSGSRPQFGLQGAVVTQMRKKTQCKKKQQARSWGYLEEANEQAVQSDFF